MSVLRCLKKQLLFLFMLFAFAGVGFSQTSRTWSNDYRLYAYVQDLQVVVCNAEDGSMVLEIPADFESIISVEFIEAGPLGQNENDYYLLIQGSSEDTPDSQMHLIRRNSDAEGREFFEDYIIEEAAEQEDTEQDIWFLKR